MAKVLAFGSQGLARKGKPIAERVTLGKLIEFPKRRFVKNPENPNNGKSDQPIAPPQFFGCF
jgi:hypothetical protein